MHWRLLSGLSDEDQASVLDAARRHEYATGDRVFDEGAVGTSLHLLESGRVAVRVTTPDGDVATLTIVGPGDAFGEMALLRRSSTRSATAVALEPVTTLSLERAAFVRLCTEQPTVEGLLVGLLAARVERLSGHLVEALYLPADKRIVRRLVELCKVYGSPGDTRVVLRLRQEDLAGLAGTRRPTVNTVLGRLQDMGAVALSRGRVEVLDVAALERAGS